MKFTETHEWIEVSGDTGVVGITQYAQKELGDIVYVELPKVGKSVQAGEEAVVLESTKAAADVYSPVTGTIVEINTTLNQASEIVNQSPEKEGWLFKIKLKDREELNQLLDETAYQSMIKAAH
jgi:glycine cleavage system H protein